jgi:hypothetical protein
VKTETRPTVKPRPAWRSRRIVSWALFLVAVGAAVVFLVLWLHTNSELNAANRADQDRAEVTSTATAFLNALTNFKGSTIEDDVARIKSFAVDGFASQVDRFFGPTSVSALRKANAVSRGQVQRVFIESLASDEADVFAVVNETITNSSTTTPRAQVLRIDLGMIHASSGWKVSRVDILQSPRSTPIPGA